MANDFCLRPETVLAGSCLAGVHYPIVKLAVGPSLADVSDANPLPVAIISGGGGGSSGGLTNTELRATPVPISGTVTANVGTVPVTGTFWQATQPVSGAFFQATQPVSIAATVAISASALPLPSGAATETTVAAISTKTPALGQAAMASSSPVVIASNQSAVPVSGTFWQTTQPISGTVTANAGTGTFAVSGTFWQATQPVSGAFWQATQPVSGPVTDTQLRASAIATKDYVQSTRVVRNFILDAFTAAPVAEAMQSVAQWYNNAAVGATVSPAVVPSGKILRLTGGRIETKSLATVGSVIMRVRVNVAGTAVIGSPLAASAACGSTSGATTVAMTGGHDHAEFTFGDEGLEIPAAAGVGFSLAGYGPTGTLTLQGVTRFEVWGYEYTA